MTDYLDVGLFLDHRQTRALVRREALGKRFLNLFCYSGSFTCYAADGGASSTVSVDLSPTYLDWATANLEENQLTTRDWQNVAKRRTNENKPVLPTENLFIKSDVIRFLKAIPPASDRNRDVVRLIEETASEVEQSSEGLIMNGIRRTEPVKILQKEMEIGLREARCRICFWDIAIRF